MDSITLTSRSPQSKNGAWIAASIAGVTVTSILALVAPFVVTKSPLPYMATPSKKVKDALMFLQQQNPKHPRQTFVDLGSGDGEAVYQAAMLGYEQSIGIELNHTLWVVAQIRRNLFWPSHIRRKTQFLCQDMFLYDFSRADTVMIFGVNPLMKRISKKLAGECRLGTAVLSYRFSLPLRDGDAKGATPNSGGSTDRDGLLAATIIYDQDECRIYQCQ